MVTSILSRSKGDRLWVAEVQAVVEQVEKIKDL